MSRQAREAIEVFDVIDTKNGDTMQCWPYIGNSFRKGRGCFFCDGKKWDAHVLAYVLVNGPIPEGQVVRHKCDNLLCCNPTHLELGTRSDNEQDKYLRDRAGIPVAAVREIKRLLQTSNASQQLIAQFVSKRFNYDISREAVRNIHLGIRRARTGERTADEVAGLDLLDENCTQQRNDEDQHT